MPSGHARRARDAFRDFDGGGGHPAGLHDGDAFGYALATGLRAPLLVTRGDFALTALLDAPA